MNNTVDWFMVEVKQKNLSEAMGFAKTAFGDDAVSFFDKLKKGGYIKAFVWVNGTLAPLSKV